jgi:uncharacterized OB-fold protein
VPEHANVSSHDVARAAPIAMASVNPNSWTEPFWAAAAKHRLVVQRCSACGNVRHPPGPFCPRCRRQDSEWMDLDGRATLYSFTVIRHPLAASLAEYLPMVIAVVAFEEAPTARLVANLVEVEVGDVVIGMGLELVWQDTGDGTAVYRFRPEDPQLRRFREMNQ